MHAMHVVQRPIPLKLAVMQYGVQVEVEQFVQLVVQPQQQ